MSRILKQQYPGWLLLIAILAVAAAFMLAGQSLVADAGHSKASSTPKKGTNCKHPYATYMKHSDKVGNTGQVSYVIKSISFRPAKALFKWYPKSSRIAVCKFELRLKYDHSTFRCRVIRRGGSYSAWRNYSGRRLVIRGSRGGECEGTNHSDGLGSGLYFIRVTGKRK